MNRSLLGAATFCLLFYGCGTDPDANIDKKMPNDSSLVQSGVNKDTVLVNLNEKIRNNIDDASLYHERAKHYAQLGDWNFAYQDIMRALNLDSKNCDYNVTYAEFYVTQNKLPEAQEVLENILRVNDACVDGYIGLADIYLYKRDNNNSIKYLDEALKRDIHNAEAYFKKGINFMELGDTVKAISSIQTAVEQDPEFYDGFVQLGVLMAQKRDPLAEQYYKAALRLDSSSLEVLYNLGMYYQEVDKLNDAIDVYTKLTKKNPGFKEAYFNLGYIHMVLLEVYRPAISYFTSAINLAPDTYFQAYYNRGYCYELLGDIFNAEKDYKKALEIRPDYTLAAKGIGRLKGELGPDNKPLK